jgi:hypothetical protein
MRDLLFPDTDIAKLLLQLDELIDEARQLRGHIEHAIEARTNPVWPERRDSARELRNPGEERGRHPATKERRRS